MWPMLAGIGPILGEGIVGYFVDLDSRQTSWRYMNGSSFVNGSPITQLENPYELIIPNPKVAVLLDKEVGSSGEAIAISFIGRDNTKSFGTATCGQSTANTGYKLSDNSTLYLAVAYMADRNLNLYGDQIIPDEEANAQNIIQKAVDWIEN
jgi:carboxyl-terminal processing protease